MAAHRPFPASVPVTILAFSVAGCGDGAEEAFPEALRLARELQPLIGASQAARTAARLMDVSRRALYEAL